MSPDFVPSPDMLGLPVVPWLGRLLMSLTLAVHWMLIGGAVGGTAILLAAALRRRARPDLANAGRALGPPVIFFLSMGATFGIAPLLLVQVLYGNVLYSANVLLAFWWLGIVPLVITAFYLLYHVRRRSAEERPVGAWAPALVLVALGLVAAILVSDTLLSQRPDAWAGFYHAHGGKALFVDDATYAPRLAFALLGLLAVGGIMTAIAAKGGLVHDVQARPIVVEAGLRLAAVTSVLWVAAGVLLLLLVPAHERDALLAADGAGPWAWVAAAALASTVVTALVARRRPSGARVGLAAAACFAGLFALAYVRDVVRQQAVSPYFRLSDVPVNPQWGPFVVFLAMLGAGIVALMALVYLARAPKGKE